VIGNESQRRWMPQRGWPHSIVSDIHCSSRTLYICRRICKSLYTDYLFWYTSVRRRHVPCQTLYNTSFVSYKRWIVV